MFYICKQQYKKVANLPCSGLLKKHFTITFKGQLSGTGTFLQIPLSIKPGCRQLAVTPDPSNLLANSKVKEILAYFEG